MCFAYDRMTAKKEKSMNCYLICVFVANGCRTKNELPICGAKMQPRSCYCLLYIETFKMECVLFFVFFFLPLLPYIAPRFFSACYEVVGIAVHSKTEDLNLN